MEKWTTQNNTSPGDERERRKPVLIPWASGQRAFMTSRQLPLWRSLISLEGVPSCQDKTEVCASPRSSQNHHKRDTDSNSKCLCWQKHMELWSCLQQVITKAWEIQLALHQTIFDSLLITIMSIFSRCRVGFLQQRPWGEKCDPAITF